MPYVLLLTPSSKIRVRVETQTIVAGESERSYCTDSQIVCFDVTILREEVEPLTQGTPNWLVELGPPVVCASVTYESAFEDDVSKTNVMAMLEKPRLKTVLHL